MTLGAALPLAVAFPIAGGILAPLVARIHRRLPLVLGITAVAGALGVLGAVAARIYAGDGHVLTHFVSGERPVDGKALGIALTADPFGVTFALLTAAIGVLLLLSALSELGELGPRELGGLACLTQLLLAALIGAALAADSVDLFVWFEVAALASYGLTGFFLERPIALEAALKNMVLTSMAGFAVFAGVGMLYSSTGAVNLGQLHDAAGTSRAQLVAIALLVAGFATKAGLVPFHGWLADTYTPVPGAVSALFAALMVNLGVVALARLGLQVFAGTHALLGLLMGLGIASALVGAALALVQEDLKRLLAWDAISQTGILIAGFASARPDGVAGASYQLVNHALFKALLFLCAGAVVHSTGVTKLADMGGLARRRPLLTGAFTVGCLAIAGVPPLNGYASLGLIHESLRDEPVLFAGALLAQAITVAALGRAAYLAFYRRRASEYEHLERSRLGMRISLIALAVCCVAFGVLADPFVRHIAGPAASGLLHPAGYASAALGRHWVVPAMDVTFEYGKIADLLLAAAEVGVGALLAVWVVRTGPPRVLRWLRSVHTGSVNDYATMFAGGLVLTAVALLV
ncbi:MAG TPA: proton-conducting transporter membrane subunit [Jatrophihabitans sp.]|jgi:multicomponent Na+:H+ antiporter subunit D|nr:proton-conducting transporter membrane subunit [Jatrophihabitans sp.]